MTVSSDLPSAPTLAEMVRDSDIASTAAALDVSATMVRRTLERNGYTAKGRDRLAPTAPRLGEGDMGSRTMLQPGELAVPDPDPYIFPAFDPQPWAAGAVCGQTDPEAFFPEVGGSRGDAAKALCRGCDVRAECLEYALRHDLDFGVWGGLSEKERREFKQGDRTVAV